METACDFGEGRKISPEPLDEVIRVASEIEADPVAVGDLTHSGMIRLIVDSTGFHHAGRCAGTVVGVAAEPE